MEINGQWYIFYHRQTNRHCFSRQCCVEPIAFLPDGTIPQVEVTSCGLNGGPLKTPGCYEARIACNLSSAQGTFQYNREQKNDAAHPYFTQSAPDREQDGDQYIANMQDGAWAGYKYFDFRGVRQVNLRVRGSFSGTVAVSTVQNGAPAAQIAVSPSKNWMQFDAPLTIEDGVHALYFSCHGAGSMDFAEFTLE